MDTIINVELFNNTNFPKIYCMNVKIMSLSWLLQGYK